jgi:undecaprenyl diphosphate synthase
MKQRALQMAASGSLHVAIIMDGNGRWAQARGDARTAGHRAGAEAVRRVVRNAPRCGIGTLTLYAFSADNWGRPPREVSLLMRLLRRFLVAETDELVRNGVRLSVVGRRDRLQPSLCAAIETAEARTAAGRTLQLRLTTHRARRSCARRGC